MMNVLSWLLFWRRPVELAPLVPSGPKPPVLFLDFDGVLHAFQNGSLERIHLIEEFLRKYPQVVVVISSNWRMQYALEMLRDLFAADVADRIEGVTPVTTETPYSRFIEIIEYLEGDTRPWCALDDEAVMFPPGCPNLVHTVAGWGVTEQDLERVAQVLGLEVAPQEA
jgi:hypothetical protein